MKALRELMSSSNANKSDKSDQSLNLKRPGWNVHLASYSKSTVVSTLHKDGHRDQIVMATKNVTALTFVNPNTLACCFGHKVELWDIRDFSKAKETITVRPARSESILCVATSDDFRYLIFGGGSAVWTYDLIERKDCHAFENVHTGTIRCVNFDHHKPPRKATSSSDDKTAVVFDLEVGSQIGKVTGFGANVRCSAFSPNGKYVMSCSDDSSVKISNSTTLEVIKTRKHLSSVNFGDWISNSVIAFGDDRHSVNLWCFWTDQIISEDHHTGYIRCLALRNDHQYLVSGAGDGKVCLWKVNKIPDDPEDTKKNANKKQNNNNKNNNKNGDSLSNQMSLLTTQRQLDEEEQEEKRNASLDYTLTFINSFLDSGDYSGSTIMSLAIAPVSRDDLFVLRANRLMRLLTPVKNVNILKSLVLRLVVSVILPETFDAHHFQDFINHTTTRKTFGISQESFLQKVLRPTNENTINKNNVKK